MENEIKCPKCLSNQISANKKGFSGRKAVAGGLLTGGIGLFAGTLGSNKIIVTCLACGFSFKAGDYQHHRTKFERGEKNKLAIKNFIKRIFKIN